MQFGLVEMFQAMSVLAKIVSFILIGLSVISIYLLIERTMFYAKAKNLSKAAAPKLSELLKTGQIKEAQVMASKKEYQNSHLALVVKAATTEFLEGKETGLPFEQQLESASRGCDRAASFFNQRLKKGLSVLATIATSSPFIGLFGTISGIINAFKGMAATGSGGIAAVASGIAEALVTTAFGIGVAIIALWCYNYLSTRTETYDAEMSNMTSQVIDFFVRKQAK
ncbi:MAG: MotA/TolQ/ExbB proton channel family protein [Acidobacteriota bacterium]|jgi:Biopolymer transport proteins|nr:MotA/TolQ/ExbB proton channel family protein [Acidobacteriota bacterium]OQB57746.1 MAG: Biopolymer transport protein ExbB [Candidatus Aminicenantes bacterium ADurb.Bin147]HNQ81437.1 MotA/TolQ/ExbB proton channel family protein [Candidatus Aminicenantes bacterium]MDD8034342.1 MotA/TolQ/ExbB proton channel family protein [Acidobacteriota bacterium]MDD8037900.1 MotA/TolQ/ExbB proton channel family protein [Acidobacteriota bacterium]